MEVEDEDEEGEREEIDKEIVKEKKNLEKECKKYNSDLHGKSNLFHLTILS